MTFQLFAGAFAIAAWPLTPLSFAQIPMVRFTPKSIVLSVSLFSDSPAFFFIGVLLSASQLAVAAATAHTVHKMDACRPWAIRQKIVTNGLRTKATRLEGFKRVKHLRMSLSHRFASIMIFDRL